MERGKIRINGLKDSCEGCPGVCCIVLAVDELGKPNDVRCRHLTSEGRCGVYKKRPWVCKNWDCANTLTGIRNDLIKKS